MKNLILEGSKIMNVTDTISCPSDYTHFIQSLIRNKTKEPRFLWIRVNPVTKPIFELLLPLMKSFSKYEKERFLVTGAILVGSTGFMFCSFTYGSRDQYQMKEVPLRVMEDSDEE